jgi:hypothetical protein
MVFGAPTAPARSAGVHSPQNTLSFELVFDDYVVFMLPSLLTGELTERGLGNGQEQPRAI